MPLRRGQLPGDRLGGRGLRLTVANRFRAPPGPPATGPRRSASPWARARPASGAVRDGRPAIWVPEGRAAADRFRMVQPLDAQPLQSAVPVRLGVLGCGNVGGALVELVRRSASRHRGPHRPRPLDLEGRGAVDRPRSRRHRIDPAVLTTDALAVVHRSGHRRHRRGHRRHRARPRAHPRRAEGGQAGRHRQQGAARQPRRRAVRSRGQPPASTCCSRPRSPVASR